MDPYAEAFPSGCATFGYKDPVRVHIKKQGGKWTVLIEDRSFYVSQLERNQFLGEWPAPYTNWPEILERCKEDIQYQTRRIAQMRARETRERKKMEADALWTTMMADLKILRETKWEVILK